MTTHELKSWPEFFEPILNGAKSFELRVNDRDFQVFDLLWLKEWDPKTKNYSGRQCFRSITYVEEGLGPGCIEPLKGLLRGYVILSLVYSDGL